MPTAKKRGRTVFGVRIGLSHQVRIVRIKHRMDIRTARPSVVVVERQYLCDRVSKLVEGASWAQHTRRSSALGLLLVRCLIALLMIDRLWPFHLCLRHDCTAIRSCTRMAESKLYGNGQQSLFVSKKRARRRSAPSASAREAHLPPPSKRLKI